MQKQIMASNKMMNIHVFIIYPISRIIDFALVTTIICYCFLWEKIPFTDDQLNLICLQQPLRGKHLLPDIMDSFLRSSGVKHMTEAYVSYWPHLESFRHSLIELSEPEHPRDFPTRMESNVFPYAEQQIALPSTNPSSRHTTRADMSSKPWSQIRLQVSL